MGQVRTLFRTKIGDVDTTQKEPLGALRFQDGAWYKYMQIQNDTATVAGVAGDPVAFAITLAGSTYDGASNHVAVLDLSDAAAQPICAGCLTGSVTGTVDTAYYTWVQIRGVVAIPTAINGTPVIGSGVMMDTTDKALTKVTGVIYPIGVALATTAANNKIFLTCPF